MSFSDTSDDIRIEVLDGQTILYASARNTDGDSNETSIDLDEVIGNDNGWFSRNVSGFSQSAQEIKLEFRDDGAWLVAELLCADGSYRELQGINLDLHITNNDGQLEWVSED